MNTKYLIYGETLDSEEKLKNEIELFFEFLFEVEPKLGKYPPEFLSEFSKTRPWGKRNESFASDLKAVWNYWEREHIHKRYVKEWWNSPEGKRERIALKRGFPKAPSIEQSKEIERLDSIADEKAKYLSEATNKVEWEERFPDFIVAHKADLNARGVKPCKARDCAKFVTNPRRLYCSEGCRKREKSRRNREKNPKKYLGLKLKHLKFLKKEGDI